MPGYTHLQQAQPIYISHYLLSFFWALERDKKRFSNVMESSDQLPLGAGALAGSAFQYNRKKVASALGFSSASPNSIDATAHRDFVLEFLGTASILGNLLSRYAEDLVIWSSLEFNFVTLADSFTTGSSMMPQKKNPDSMELIRGKTGRLLGNYTSVFTTLKGAPLCYSRDLQEDKEPVFDSVSTLEQVLPVMSGAIKSMTFNLDEIARKMNKSILATDLADLLVESGLPFRDAHHLVGRLVRKAEETGYELDQLPDNEWIQVPGKTKIRDKLNYQASIERRNIEGGTGSKSVARQMTRARRILKSHGKLDT